MDRLLVFVAMTNEPHSNSVKAILAVVIAVTVIILLLMYARTGEGDV